MEIVGYTPKLAPSLTLPMQELILMPIGDIQYGAEGCDLDRLKKHIAWGVAQGAYFIGMGDYVDVASPSNRKMLAVANSGLYDSVRQMMDEKMESVVDELKKVLAPTKGRWFGLIDGHHLWPFGDGSTSTSRLADYLGTVSLGDCGVVILRLEDPRPAQRNATGASRRVAIAKIWAHHGQGSGQTAGAALNKLEHAAKRFFANVYLMGHYHSKPAVPIPWIDYEWDGRRRVRFHSINRYLVATGGFLKGYELGTKNPLGHPSGSYIEKAMLPPVTLGGTVVYLRPRRRNDRWLVDVNVSV